MTTYPLISVIDDDLSVRVALDNLLESSGYSTSVFGKADGFLSSSALWESDCIISDVELPERAVSNYFAFFARKG